MFDYRLMVKIAKIPLTLLIALTCVGILINFLNIIPIIIIWWVGVLGLCALCSAWAGYQAAHTHKLDIINSGITGSIVWLIPGAIGLTISAFNGFLSALLWGAIEGYEILAFLGGLVVIVILLAIGAVIAFVLGVIGGILGKNKKKR